MAAIIARGGDRQFDIDMDCKRQVVQKLQSSVRRRTPKSDVLSLCGRRRLRPPLESGGDNVFDGHNTILLQVICTLRGFRKLGVCSYNHGP
jgi:hypothetical protein